MNKVCFLFLFYLLFFFTHESQKLAPHFLASPASDPPIKPRIEDWIHVHTELEHNFQKFELISAIAIRWTEWMWASEDKGTESEPVRSEGTGALTMHWEFLSNRAHYLTLPPQAFTRLCSNRSSQGCIFGVCLCVCVIAHIESKYLICYQSENISGGPYI